MMGSLAGAYRRGIQQLARTAVVSVETLATPGPDARGGELAGTVVDGEWVAYGMTGMTTLGEGFRCRKGPRG